MAEPTAAKRCECSGAIVCSGVRLNVRMNACFNSERK